MASKKFCSTETKAGNSALKKKLTGCWVAAC
jgi:hypothetical protein